MYRITLTPTLTSGWNRQGVEDIRVYCVDQWSVVQSTMELVYMMQKHRNFGVMHDDVPPDGRTPLAREVAATKSRNGCCMYVQGEQEIPEARQTGDGKREKHQLVHEIG